MSVTKTMKIGGMSCSHCATAVEKALNGLPGVNAKVDLRGETATVVINGDVSDETLKKAVEEEDYEVISIAS